ncbi:MAG: hypothetical protein P4K83_02100 [Terracidiphilus sp.]|nr:hypothetical protein [Terracidiphilus sp.]
MASSTQSDFVNVHLNSAGAALAGENGAIRVVTPHMNYSFTAAGSTRVLTSEWSKYLSQRTIGEAVFLELAPSVVEVPAAVKTEEATPATEVAAQSKSTKGSK